jgi:hypothetical protein
MSAVLNGWAPEELLSSYEPERRPVGARTIEVAARNMATLAPELADRRLAGSEDEFAEARPNVATAIHATKTGEFHSLELTLGYDYAESPIVVTEDPPEVEIATSATTRYQPTAAPGHRLPHHWVAPGDSLYDRLGTEFTLIGDLSQAQVARLVDEARSLNVPLSLMDVRGEGWPDRFGADLVLVRPDQHVAWRGNQLDDPVDIVRQVVGYPSRLSHLDSPDLERTS